MPKKYLIIIIILILALTLFFIFKKPLSNNVTLTPGPVVGYAFSAKYGRYLTDKTGRTLYRRVSDGDMISNCLGECLKTSPVFEFDNQAFEKFGDRLSKKLNVFGRSDGWYQYAYGGFPLYYYAGDTAPGGVNGLFGSGELRLITLSDSDFQ